MFQKALDLEEELFCIISENDINKHVPNDMSEFLSLISSDKWNQYIFESIIIETNIIKPIKSVFNYEERDLKSKINIKKKNHKLSFKLSAKLFINFFSKIIARSNSPLVVSSYLSRKNQ